MRQKNIFTVLIILFVSLVSLSAAYAAYLSVTPTNPESSQNIVCTYNDAVNVNKGWYSYLYRFRFFEFTNSGTSKQVGESVYVDGTDVTNDPSVTLNSAYTSEGKTYKCIVYDTKDNAIDSLTFSTQSTGTGNTAPGMVNIFPENPDGSATQLDCVMNSNGLYSYLYTFKWFKNNQLVKTAAGTANSDNKPSSALTTADTAFTRLVEYKCEVWNGKTLWSQDAVTIINNIVNFVDNIEDVIFPEDSSYSMDLSGNFTDADGDALIYSLETPNPNIMLSYIGDNVTLYSTIGWADPNGVTVRISATDGYSTDYSNYFLVNVTPVNIFSTPFPQLNITEDEYDDSINLGSYLTYYGTGSISASNYNYTLLNITPINTTIIMSSLNASQVVNIIENYPFFTLNITPLGNWSGYFDINFTLTVGNKTGSNVLPVYIIPVDDLPGFGNITSPTPEDPEPPESTPPTPVDIAFTFPEGMNVTFAIEVVDVDNATMYTEWRVNNQNVSGSGPLGGGAHNINITLMDFFWFKGPYSAGIHNLTLIINSTSGNRNMTWGLNVTNANNAPEYLGGFNFTVDLNTTSYNDTLVASDYFDEPLDGIVGNYSWNSTEKDVLVYSFDYSLVSGKEGVLFIESFDNITGRINLTMNQSMLGTASYNFWFIATDPWDAWNITEAILINLTKPDTATINNTFSQLNITEDEYDDSLNITDYLFDADVAGCLEYYNYSLLDIVPVNTTINMTSENVSQVVNITGTYPVFMINITPLVNWSGSFSVNFTLTDIYYNTTKSNILPVWVIPMPDTPTSPGGLNITYPEDEENVTPPVEPPLPPEIDFTFSEGTNVSFAIDIYDVDNATINVSWKINNESFLGTIVKIATGVWRAILNVVFGYKGPISSGVYNMTLNVTSTSGTNFTEVWWLNITNVNHAPEYLGGFNFTVYLNTTSYNDTIFASDYFNESIDGIVGNYSWDSTEKDQLIYNYTSEFINGTEGVLIISSFNSTTGRINLTMNRLLYGDALYNLIFTATDPEGLWNITETVLINLTETNAEPYNLSYPSLIRVLRNNYNDSISLNGWFSDPNTWDQPNEDKLNYSAVINGTTDVTAAVNNATKMLNLSAINGFTGNATLNISAFDTRGAEGRITDIIVEVYNLDPVFVNVSPANLTFYEGDLVEIQLNFFDNDNLTYFKDATFGNLDNATGLFSWQTNYSSAGVYTINFNATDGISWANTGNVVVEILESPYSANITGYIRDKNAAGIENALVKLYNPSGALVNQISSGTAGFYKFTGINNLYMNYSVNATAPNYRENNTIVFVDDVIEFTGNNITLGKQPDLRTEFITYTPATIISGETITFISNFTNLGDTDVTNVDITLIIDGTPSNTKAVDITAGSTITENLTWTATDGSHTVMMSIENIGEQNTINNNKSIIVTSTNITSILYLSEIDIYNSTLASTNQTAQNETFYIVISAINSHPTLSLTNINLTFDNSMFNNIISDYIGGTSNSVLVNISALDSTPVYWAVNASQTAGTYGVNVTLPSTGALAQKTITII